MLCTCIVCVVSVTRMRLYINICLYTETEYTVMAYMSQYIFSLNKVKIIRHIINYSIAVIYYYYYNYYYMYNCYILYTLCIQVHLCYILYIHYISSIFLIHYTYYYISYMYIPLIYVYRYICIY